MTETVVHVTTLEQWKSVLDVWFKQGYSWPETGQSYNKEYFERGKRELLLDNDNDILVPTLIKREAILYADFMAQQKEGNKMETYYVTQDKLCLIENLKDKSFPLYKLTHSERYKEVGSEFDGKQEKALLRYLGGDETIEFTVKEPLYRLWRINAEGKRVYMKFLHGTPDWTHWEYDAFTAPLDEITKWKTPAWEIEKAD